jgi:hypothetical protein
MSKDKKEYGYEGEMVMSQLKAIIQHAEQLHDLLEPDTDLPEWVQSKITLAYDYVQTAADYMATELDESIYDYDKNKTKVSIKGKPSGNRWTMHTRLVGQPGEYSVIIQTHKNGTELKNEYGGYNSYKVGKTAYVKKHWDKLSEEAPTNSAGGGAIDGIGVGPKGEPGVKPKAMKRYKDKNAEEAPKAGRKTLSLFMKGE